jgi:hypothetical protein
LETFAEETISEILEDIREYALILEHIGVDSKDVNTQLNWRVRYSGVSEKHIASIFRVEE